MKVTEIQSKPGKKSAPKRRQSGWVTRPVVLVGLMGAGKTSVGRRIARALGLIFVDSDQEIEKAANLSIAEIFELYGEGEFRALERRVIARLMDGKAKIIATGGGAFMDIETRALVQRDAVTLWLDADKDVLVERTARRKTRPLLLNTDPTEVLGRLIEERYPVYREARLQVKSNPGPHKKVVADCIQALKDYFATLKKPVKKRRKGKPNGDS